MRRREVLAGGVDGWACDGAEPSRCYGVRWSALRVRMLLLHQYHQPKIGSRRPRPDDPWCVDDTLVRHSRDKQELTIFRDEEELAISRLGLPDLPTHVED